jgi:hypothetical protein
VVQVVLCVSVTNLLSFTTSFVGVVVVVRCRSCAPVLPHPHPHTRCAGGGVGERGHLSCLFLSGHWVVHRGLVIGCCRHGHGSCALLFVFSWFLWCICCGGPVLFSSLSRDVWLWNGVVGHVVVFWSVCVIASSCWLCHTAVVVSGCCYVVATGRRERRKKERKEGERERKGEKEKEKERHHILLSFCEKKYY